MRPPSEWFSQTEAELVSYDFSSNTRLCRSRAEPKKLPVWATMSKDRKEKQEHQQVKTFEDLIVTGKDALYGQVCWSIANHGTEIHRTGDVIAIEGWGEEDNPVTEEYKLTSISIANIGRCIGMRTCAEAQALFAEPKRVEPSGEECPHGHFEAALDSMVYGIKPTEPCPRCGDIPRLSNFVSGGVIMYLVGGSIAGRRCRSSAIMSA